MERVVVRRSSRPLEQVFKDAQEIFSYGFRVGHPRFFSVVPSQSSPESWLGKTITTAFGGNREAGTGACAVERPLIQWISKQFDLPALIRWRPICIRGLHGQPHCAHRCEGPNSRGQYCETLQRCDLHFRPSPFPCGQGSQDYWVLQ